MKKYTVVALLVCAVCFTGCINSRVTIRDKQTGNCITLEKDKLDVYIKTLDSGRFSVTSETEEAVLKDGTVLK